MAQNKIYTEWDEFWEFYISKIKEYVPNYESMHPTDATTSLPPLTNAEFVNLNHTIRRLVNLPTRIHLQYAPNLQTFASGFDRKIQGLIIQYPTVTKWFVNFPSILKTAMYHEMGHIQNYDYDVKVQPTHNDCVNICMDTRINQHLNQLDLDYINRCLFTLTNEPTELVVPEVIYRQCKIPQTLDMGYALSWQEIHHHWHLFDEKETPQEKGEPIEGQVGDVVRIKKGKNKGKFGQIVDIENGKFTINKLSEEEVKLILGS